MNDSEIFIVKAYFSNNFDSSFDLSSFDSDIAESVEVEVAIRRFIWCSQSSIIKYINKSLKFFDKHFGLLFRADDFRNLFFDVVVPLLNLRANSIPKA